MTSRHSPYARDDDDQNLKRKEALHRSLRDCTSRRLTHFNPCDTRHVHTTPTLTSRVQWGNGNFSSRTSDEGLANATRNDMSEGREASMSPVQSEIDELIPSEHVPSPIYAFHPLTKSLFIISDDDHSLANSRPSTGTSADTSFSRVPHKSPSIGADSRGSPCYSDSSDTERRQPNFPGNRDIIDIHSPSTSPSPPTQHSTELATPSPSSEIANSWPSEDVKSSSSLDLHLNEKPLLRNERLARIGSWRVHSTAQDRYDSHRQGRYGTTSNLHDSPRSSYLHYSPSYTSSAPPSPPPVLPPIHHLNATLPVHTGNTPGVMHWRYREYLEPHDVKTYRPLHGNFMDDYDDARSSTTSPQSLPPLLPHIKMMAQPSSYLPPRPLTGMMPMSVAPPLAPLPNPTRNKNAWKDYAQLVSGPNEQSEFRCVWRVGYTGEVTDHCGYTAKRHLVKRHIETRHLQFKDHICPYCGKAFPQRVSLMIHVNRHTGAKPHPCRYVDCDKTFSDPARRHKHMVEAHGYNPQGPRKRHRTVDSYHGNKGFESLAPWTTKDEKPKDVVETKS